MAALRVQGRPVVVTARNREAPAAGSDPVLAALDRSEFDELWLFALDTEAEIDASECAAIGRFRNRGGGLLTARDHQDLGASLCDLGGVGAANHFHSRNLEPDPSRHQSDDRETATISWPNYHSGRNGDFQRITAIQPVHPVLRDPEDPARALEFFPAHPHEGAVSAPPGDASARVVATGCSIATGRSFNLVVAFESQETRTAAFSDAARRLPAFMKEMARTVPDAAPYVPVTILVDERSDGVHLSYDSLASLLVPYGSPEALRVAKDLDAKIESLLETAAR